jgi:anti-sigma B factor antagonist
MYETLSCQDADVGSRESLPGVFVCELTGGGLGVAWVHVAAELDIATAPILARTLRSAELRARLVVLDLRELTFVDSSGVRVIVYASLRARRAGRRLVLVRGPAQVQRLLALSGALDAVEIFDLAAGEPAVQVLLQLAHQDQAA